MSDLDPSRRRFIRLVGGGAVLAATGAALGGCSASYPNDATAAWRDAAPQPQQDLRRFMLAHALLAPNPHNRQPWIADLRGEREIVLVCDGERLLPETDPHGRQILIGCGAFIELAVLAAASQRVAVEVELFPGGEPGATALPAGITVARLRLGNAGSAEPDALFAQVRRRHTNKTAYDNARTLPRDLVAAWQANAQRFGLRSGLVEGAPAMDPIRRLTREAYEIECLTPRTWLESARLMRIGPDAISKHRDGISLNAPMIRALHGAGLFDPMEVPRAGSSTMGRVMERWPAFETGSGYLWLATDGNARRAQVDSGRAYVRCHLQATAGGADMHPLSQALQEFTEMDKTRAALHEALGLAAPGRTLQMLARVGYAVAPTQPSPRRDLATMIRA